MLNLGLLPYLTANGEKITPANPYAIGGAASFDHNITMSIKDPIGEQRWFLLNTPQEAGKKFPAIINSHGYGGTSMGQAQFSGLWKTGPERGIVVAHTQGWAANDSLFTPMP